MFANYYEVLGVDAAVDDAALRKAFRRCSWEAHPDRGGSTERMKLINEAWTVLSNPQLRELYDKTRWGKPQSSAGASVDSQVGEGAKDSHKNEKGPHGAANEKAAEEEAERELWRYMEFHNRMHPGLAQYYTDPKMATARRVQKHLVAFWGMLRILLLIYVIVFFAFVFLYLIFVAPE